MKVTIFTSNHPRHLALVLRISAFAERVFAIHEAKTMFPGRRPGIFRESAWISDYFKQVYEAEFEVFGSLDYMPENVCQLLLAHGDLNLLDPEIFGEAWDADCFIVFGASYIKRPLIDRLISKKAINIHIGVSPMYRGNSCNFWSLYDGFPQYVGATIHLLSSGLDSGEILFHALPQAVAQEPFILGMKAVESAHIGIAEKIRSGELMTLLPIEQDRAGELRYTRAEAFNEDVVRKYLCAQPTSQQIGRSLESRNLKEFIAPYVPN